ncbi:MAG: rhodanese-like domain-containing protein, partial [Acidimicrobiia bacterium]
MPASHEILPADVDVAAFDRILDVRPANQRSLTIEGSLSAPIDQLLAEPGAFIPSAQDRVLVLCDIGMRSAIARTRLSEAGYADVSSLAGGIDAWRAAKLPVVGAAGLTPEQLERYDRHLKLPGFGASAQAKLL